MLPVFSRATGAVLSAVLLALAAPACKKGDDSAKNALKAGSFLILGTRTDAADFTVAKQNAENTLQLHPDLVGMVGLYGYNTPKCLEALREAANNGRDVLGKVKIFGFDGQEETLEGIEAGHVTGTIIQQPFEFDYQSMKVLKALYEGADSGAPNGMLDIPVKTVTKDNVADYRKEMAEVLASSKEAVPEPPAGAPVFGFVPNNQSSFWEEARAGCMKASRDFGIGFDFQMPDQQEAVAQNRILESMMQKGALKGVAVSVVSPESQGDVLAKVAEKMPLITHDSDAPKSPRKVYLGTNNYEAGRALGKLIRQTLPEGGKLMIFVGSVDAVNATERPRGLLDELSAP